MKKAFVILVALMLCITLTAGAEATKVTFWHCMSDEAGTLMDQYVTEFNATIGADKGIEVEAVYQGAYKDAASKMKGILQVEALEDLPAVMQLDATGKVAYATSGAAYTVDMALADHTDADVSALLPAAMANWNYAGMQLGLPFATSTTIMYYNKTLLDAAGVAAPRTFADLSAMAAALPATTADNAPLVPYTAVPNTPTLANWLGQLGSYVVDNMNGSEANATQLVCIENGALATFLTEWKSMYEHGAVTTDAGSTDAFVAGLQAVMTSSSSNITSMKEKIGDRFELGVANYPKVNEDASFGATVSGSCVVMFNKDEAVNEAAWTFVQYLTGADVQADFAMNTGYIPSNSGALETETYKALVESDPAYAVGLTQVQETPAAMRSVTVGPSADFYYAIQDCVTAMLDDDMTVEETVAMMEEELNGLLDQYNQANP